MANRDKKLGKLHKKGGKRVNSPKFDGADRKKKVRKLCASKRYGGDTTLFEAVVEVESGRVLETTREPEGFRSGVYVDDTE